MVPKSSPPKGQPCPKEYFVQNVFCSKLLDCGPEDPEEDKIGPPCFQRERFPCKHGIDKIHCTLFNYDIDDGRQMQINQQMRIGANINLMIGRTG